MRLRGSWRAVVAACVVAGCASAGTPAARYDGVPWSPFRWVKYDIAGRTYDKAALFVPFASDTLGGSYWLQLDTGAYVGVWVYRNPLRQLLARRGVPLDSAATFRITGTIGNYAIRDEPLQRHSNPRDTLATGDTLPKIGTLGLNFFRDKVLVLDLPGERFAIVDSAAALPEWIERGASWVPVEYRNGKMFVHLTLNDSVYTGFFYDSGASLFAVNTTPEIWRAVTGRTGTEPNNVDWKVPSFGQEILMRGAPVRNASVGTASLERPLAFYMAEGPERLDFSKVGFPMEGLFGNALFYDRYIVVVDLPRRRFGIIEREDMPAPARTEG